MSDIATNSYILADKVQRTETEKARAFLNAIQFFCVLRAVRFPKKSERALLQIPGRMENGETNGKLGC